LGRVAKIFDLIIVSFNFLTVMATTTGEAKWPEIANVFAIRITIGNLIVFALYLGLCSIIFTACGLYRSHRFSIALRRVREIVVAVTLVTAVIFLLRGLLDLSFAKDGFLLLFWLLLTVSLTLFHEMALRLLYFARWRGRNLRHIVIVGEMQEAAALAERIGKDSSLGYRVVDVIHPGGSQE
jgi:FlaA1/EpsC-like NDP-sugar epimerase